MHLILTGGGTAGHVTPNIGLIEELKAVRPDLKITYIGSQNGLEKDLLSDQPVDFKTIPVGKLRRYFDLQNVTDMFKVPIGVIKATYLIRSLKPNLVFSKGGYVGLPVVIGAWLNRVPVVIHESDSVPGLTTKITKRFASESWSSYAIDGFVQVDMPIRDFLTKGDAKKFKHDSKPTLLAMGGSQGAQGINDFIAQNLDELTAKFQVIHITGTGKSLNKHAKDYIPFEYLKQELADAYAAADYILTRSGAGTLTELKALQKKAILIPLPTNRSRGEQLTNAKLFAEENPAIVITQDELNLQRFENGIQDLQKRDFEPHEPEASASNRLLAWMLKIS